MPETRLQDHQDPQPDPRCLCGHLHPCPTHGAWARPTDEQLLLIEDRR